MTPGPPDVPEDVQATFAATLVDEWGRGGLRDAVVCPGSRSTPLALAFAQDPGITVHVHQDERSAGFLALGLALASGRTVAVLTTSGTAAVELHPAVTEAHHAGVPLLVCTADRPPDLRDVGAPQTIDQTRLYGGAVRWFGDPGVADAAVAAHWRSLAARALAATCATPRSGPVHLNLPFREPLVGTPGPLPPGRPTGPWTVALPPPGRTAVDGSGGPSVRELAGRRGLILAGHPGPDPADLVRVAEGLGWPVVADPQSSAWGPSPVAVAHLDGILRSERARSVLQPEVILRLGAPPASRVVNEWCATGGALEIVVSGGAWSDPAGTAAIVVASHPADVVAALAREVDASNIATPAGWLDRWRTVGDTAADALAQALGGAALPAESVASAEASGIGGLRASAGEPAGGSTRAVGGVGLPAGASEPGVARDVVAALPDGAQLVVSSSMPIRDVERYATPRSGVRVLANRGANGIDGVVSTAVGAALTGRPTGLLVGDLALLHDSNGLLGAASRGIDLVVVVVDNDGGGIFSFLPQARTVPEDQFETLFGTPHGLDLVALAEAYGVRSQALDGDGNGGGSDDLAKAVTAALDEGGVHVLVVRTERVANVEAHRVLDDAIAAAVDTVLAGLTSA